MRETPRARHLRVKYGITEEQFDQMADEYAGACWICRNVPKGRLQVDHDHTTGEIRGLLCWVCNKFLDYRWTCQRLERASEYMGGNAIHPPPDEPPSYTGLFVPKKKRRKRIKK